jgi:hypothetical protein
MTNFHPGFKHWNLILEKFREWERLKPGLDSVTRLLMSVDGIPLMNNHYTDDEINELKMTDRIAVSTYVQGNGPETGTYTNKEMACEIRAALREYSENIIAPGLTELVVW